MATKKANPLKTKNDRTRILVLNKSQLSDAIEKSSSNKIRDKMQRRLNNLTKRGV